jgi:hypothetical protein
MMVKDHKLDRKLRSIQNKIGQKIVVHVGVKEGGEFDLLGVDCCGEPILASQKTKSCASYIG